MRWYMSFVHNDGDSAVALHHFDHAASVPRVHQVAGLVENGGVKYRHAKCEEAQHDQAVNEHDIVCLRLAVDVEVERLFRQNRDATWDDDSSSRVYSATTVTVSEPHNTTRPRNVEPSSNTTQFNDFITSDDTCR